MWELVIIWFTSEKDIHTYPTREEAEKAELGKGRTWNAYGIWKSNRLVLR